MLPVGVTKEGLLYKYQSGFRTNFSADCCLVQLTDFISTGMDKRFHTGIILADIQKAFDTLDHTLLLQKNWNVLVLKGQSLNGVNHFHETEHFL